MKKQLQSFLLFVGLCMSGMAYGQSGTIILDTTSATWGGMNGFFNHPTVYDTIPAWLLTTTREDLATMTQRKGYSIKPRELAIGMITYGNYKPAETITVGYLDANKKPITNFIVWMSVRRKEN